MFFVIDAKAGVTATDEIFAKTVRTAGRPVILLANKCEGRASDEGFYEAFKLGFGEPFPSLQSMAWAWATSSAMLFRPLASSRR